MRTRAAADQRGVGGGEACGAGGRAAARARSGAHGHACILPSVARAGPRSPRGVEREGRPAPPRPPAGVDVPGGGLVPYTLTSVLRGPVTMGADVLPAGCSSASTGGRCRRSLPGASNGRSRPAVVRLRLAVVRVGDPGRAGEAVEDAGELAREAGRARSGRARRDRPRAPRRRAPRRRRRPAARSSGRRAARTCRRRPRRTGRGRRSRPARWRRPAGRPPGTRTPCSTCSPAGAR